MKTILHQLFEHKTLDRGQARDTLLQIAKGAYNPVQVASFMTVYQMRPIILAELLGFSDALLELCMPVDGQGIDAVDIVGTGGDGKNTFNISTLAAVVVAGAGYKVVKHGNYGVSSAVGSSNVLEALGYQFTNDTDELRRQLDRAGLCFMHAPLFHPALKEVAPVRRQLGMKTFFNMLGPLVNPLQPKYQLLGTYSLELSRLYQYAMQERGRKYAIVYGLDGYDEISLTGAFKLRTNESERLWQPEHLGLPRYEPETLHGGETPEAAAAIFRDVLHNRSTPAQRDVVVANAGVAIYTMKPGSAIGDCLAEARESLESGKALRTLQALLP